MCLEEGHEQKLNKRDVLRANFKGISEEMSKVDWESYLNGLEIEEAYKRFLHAYERIWNECVPLKRNRKENKCRGWMSEEIRGMIKHKHKLWYKIKSDKDKTEYRR